MLQINDTVQPISVSDAAQHQGCVHDGPNKVLCPTYVGSSVQLKLGGENGALTVQTPGITAALAVTSTAPIHLTIDDSAAVAPVPAGTITVSGSVVTGLGPAQINFTAAQIASLAILGGNHGNAFTVFDTPDTPYGTTLQTGSGTNTVWVQGTTGALIINGQGGADTVVLGRPAAAGGVLDEVKGTVTVRNTGPFTNLIVEDNGATSAAQGVIGDVDSTGFGQIDGSDPNPPFVQQFDKDDPNQPLVPASIVFQYAGLHALTIEAGSGGNAINVADTGAGFTTTLDSGAGTDVVNIQGTNGPLVLDGQAGRDRVTIGQWQQQTGVTDPGSTLAAICGPVTIGNKSGLTDLIMDDDGDKTGQPISLTGATLTGMGMGPQGMISYAAQQLNSLTLIGGAGGPAKDRADADGSGGNSWEVNNLDPGLGFTTTLDTTAATNGDQVAVTNVQGTLQLLDPTLLDPNGKDDVVSVVNAPYFEHLQGMETIDLNLPVSGMSVSYTSVSGTLSAVGQVDFYTINVPAGGTFTATVSGPASTPVACSLALYSEDSFFMLDGSGQLGGDCWAPARLVHPAAPHRP